MWVNSTMYRIDHHVKYFNGPIIFSHHKLCCLSFLLDLYIWERERPDSILRAIECVCVAPHIKAPGTHPLPHNHISIDSHMLHINVHVFVCCSWILSILLHPSFYCRHIKELIFCGCVCVCFPSIQFPHIFRIKFIQFGIVMLLLLLPICNTYIYICVILFCCLLMWPVFVACVCLLLFGH